MRIYQVNSTGRFSTGTIANQIHEELLKSGHASRFAFGLGGDIDENRIETNTLFRQRLDSRCQRFLGKEGIFCNPSTKKIINDLEKFQPDLIHLHNLHGNYLNLEYFLTFLSEYGKPVILTLHDCWPFTGGCYHFTTNHCEGWKEQCNKCQFLDNPYRAEKEHKLKTKLFNNFKELSIITVSKWLKDIASESIFKNRNIKYIYNGINLNDFCILKDNNLNQKRKDKKVILGVASTWNKGKGLGKWFELANILDSDYQIVLVGLNSRQIQKIPSKIIALPRVNSIYELTELYNIANVYVNMSMEETFGLPTVESMACGTPAIVFNSTSNPELIDNGYNGLICNDFSTNSVYKAIITVCKKDKQYWKENCRKYVLEHFSIEKMTNSYIQHYKEILGNI